MNTGLNYACFNCVVLIVLGLFALQNVPKPGHKRTDSTHSSNESEYTFSSEIAETEDIPLRTEVHFRPKQNIPAILAENIFIAGRAHLPIMYICFELSILHTFI